MNDARQLSNLVCLLVELRMQSRSTGTACHMS